jgi:hypothetical protein
LIHVGDAVEKQNRKGKGIRPDSNALRQIAQVLACRFLALRHVFIACWQRLLPTRSRHGVALQTNVTKIDDSSTFREMLHGMIATRQMPSVGVLPGRFDSNNQRMQ